jgi:hypothetical protein
MTVISYPIPAYSNLPIDADFYQPSRFVISNITRGQTTTVTTTQDTNYVIGQLIRFIIPPSYGIRQLNEQEGYVIAIPSSNQVTVNIDSTQMDAFINSSATTKAQILAIGDINSGPVNTGRTNNTTFISGSFINISPQ